MLFLVELAAWASFGVRGWHVGGGPWRWVLAVGLPLVVVGLWRVVAAPTSARRLRDPGLFAFQLGVFLLGAVLLGAVLLVFADRPVWGATLGIVGLVVVGLDRALPFATTGWEAQEKRRRR